MSDWKKQLESKKRTVTDLARYIKDQAGGVPNYCFLLGAGASVTSGIRSGKELVDQWARQLTPVDQVPLDASIEECKSWIKGQRNPWYSETREYSSLFERCYDLPVQRRIFIEKEVADKKPSIGYAYLTNIVEREFISTIFTTNFDDLVTEAFFQFSRCRPIVCAHDSAISSISVTAKRPKLIKLHGDYLFDDIKATRSETESLEENMRKKLGEFARDFGMVVVGYSGCDKSIMDPLHSLIKSQEHFKSGLYWCVRGDEAIPEDVQKLFWRERVYWVEIDGFDELMAELHHHLLGDQLPIDTSMVTERPVQLVKQFCDNEYLRNSKSPKLRGDIAKLEKISNREQLLGIVRGDRDDVEDKSGDVLSDSEMVRLINIRRAVADGLYDSARDQISAGTGSGGLRFERELQEIRIDLEERDGKSERALDLLDEQIAADPYEPERYIRKSSLVLDKERRISVVEEGIQRCPDSSALRQRKLECLIDWYHCGALDKRTKLLVDIKAAFEDCRLRNPLPNNPAFLRMADFYVESAESNRVGKESLLQLACLAEACYPQNLTSLRIRMLALSRQRSDRTGSEAEQLLASIADRRERASRAEQFKYDILRLDALLKFKRTGVLNEFITECLQKSDIADKPSFKRRYADWILQVKGDGRQAVDVLASVLKREKSSGDAIRIASICSAMRDPDLLDAVLSDHLKTANPYTRLSVERYKHLAQRRYDEAFQTLRQLARVRMVLNAHAQDEVHDLLLAKRYADARKRAQKIMAEAGNEKREFGPLLINFEIATARESSSSINARKIAEIAAAAESLHVQFVCKILLKDLKAAADLLKQIIEEDRFDAFEICTYAVSSDPAVVDMVRRELDSQGLSSLRLPGGA